MAKKNQNAEEKNTKQQTAGAPTKTPDAIALLKQDHREVEALFNQVAQAKDPAQKRALAQHICDELIIHTLLEEELFYPACREHVDDEKLEAAQVEHDSAKLLINEIKAGEPSEDFYEAKLHLLTEMVKSHIAEEEQRGEGIFAKAKANGVDLASLAQKITARKQELKELAEEDDLPLPRPYSFRAARSMFMQEKEERKMPQYNDRDDNGRYRDRDDDRRGSRGRETPERDQYGRFMSDDDDDRRSSGRSSRSRDYDDERENRSRGGQRGGEMRSERARGARAGEDRRQGGWFGDPEGHSEASRRGWERSDHERSGWYGDSRGHSEASRRGWQRSDHEGAGWYGDPEGHSEASRRGWEERGGSRGRSRRDDDDYERRSSSSRGRSRDDDDDDRRGRGRGGWFGDSEGHSEASRRGWDDRR